MLKFIIILLLSAVKIKNKGIKLLYPIDSKNLLINNETLIVTFDTLYKFLIVLNDINFIVDEIGFTPNSRTDSDKCSNFFAISNVQYNQLNSNFYLNNLIFDNNNDYTYIKLYVCYKLLNSNDWIHQGDEFYIYAKSKPYKLPLYASILIAIFLLLLSGLFSGLNIGLMSLDVQELEVIVATGNSQEKKYAQNIIPLRKLGNILLVSILLSNTAVNSTLTIIIDKISTGTIAIVVSTVCIMIIGEIIPQSICSRYSLLIGSYTRYIMWFFIFLSGIVCFPLGYLINYILGPEPLTVFGRQQLLDLIRLHGKNVNLHNDEVGIISGALNFCSKAVKDAMVPIENSFLLNENTILDFDTTTKIVQSGFSRIPVYAGSIHNIVGLLLLKDLTLVDPDDNVPLITVVNFYKRPIIKVFSDITLDKLFTEFKNGVGHLAVVLKVQSDGKVDPYYQAIGVITLEDILEEIIQAEIIDETDFLNPKLKTQTKVIQNIIPFFNQKTFECSQLSPNMALTVFQFLSTGTLFYYIFILIAVDPFSDKYFCENTLKNLITRSDVIFKYESNQNESIYLYQKNVISDTFTFIIEGKVEIISGQDNIKSIHGPFTYFGVSALIPNNNPNSDPLLFPPPQFKPDFSAKVIETVICLKITNSLYSQLARFSQVF